MKLEQKDIENIKNQFIASYDQLVALGDETRLQILLRMMNGPCSGSRVIDICKIANLSRSSVSAHLQILIKAGFVSNRKEGTQVFYYLNPSALETGKLKTLFTDLDGMIQNIPDRQGDELYGNKV